MIVFLSVACSVENRESDVILSEAEGSLDLGESLLEEILRFAQDDR